MREEETLGLGWREVLAAADDEVLRASGDRQVAAGVERAAVARAPGCPGLRRFRWVA
jgi:hypothetical protein